ncbi:MAG TPA: hypothetical protein VMW27_26640 [Thermoanaerobaculia bacterium]|nr:hypothetical protein [Thermoanaerobaculia bacterium]
MATPAETAAASGNGYNYYPRTMMQLSGIAYDSIADIPAAVRQLGWRVVWGPSQLVDEFGVSYSLAFVAYRDDLQEYTVVIRGTPLDSWTAWTTETFDIATTVPFNQLVPDAPAGARISQGTCNGINDLLRLRDPGTGVSLVSFLKRVNPLFLYVTGHSLGGMLAPPLFAYLNYELYGGGFVHNMALWSFAGLTPGNAAFNNYFNSLGNKLFPWRLYNTLDIAPFCWWSKAGIESIYSPRLPYGEPEQFFVDGLFGLAAGKGYAQPVYGGMPLPGVFHPETGFLAWVDEALYQHEVATYQQLVDRAYPLAQAGIAANVWDQMGGEVVQGTAG